MIGGRLFRGLRWALAWYLMASGPALFLTEGLEHGGTGGPRHPRGTHYEPPGGRAHADRCSAGCSVGLERLLPAPARLEIRTGVALAARFPAHEWRPFARPTTPYRSRAPPGIRALLAA